VCGECRVLWELIDFCLKSLPDADFGTHPQRPATALVFQCLGPDNIPIVVRGAQGELVVFKIVKSRSRCNSKQETDSLLGTC